MITCVMLPHFPLLVELQRRPELRAAPVVVAQGPKLSDLVLDCSPEAAADGVRTGMALHTVVTLCREATLLIADPVQYQDRFEAMLNALELVSPLVESEALGCAFLDLKGLNSLYPTAAVLVQDLQQQVMAVSHAAPQVGIAEGKFPAKVAALQAQPGGCVVLSREETRDFLAPLSVDRLPVSEEMQSRLMLLGLRTLGQLAVLPLPALQAQFGKEGNLAWHLANGLDTAPLVPRQHQESQQERLAFDAPITSLEALTVAVRELVGRVDAHSTGERTTVRQLRFRLVLEDSRSWERAYTPNEPLSTQERLACFLLSKLEAIGLPGPVAEIALEVTASGGEAGRQGRLFHDGGHLEHQIGAAARQLAVRYGRSPLMKVVAVEPWSRIPERRWALITYEP